MKNNSYHIALDVSQMAYQGHGVGRYTNELARALLALNTPHRFTFFVGALRQGGFFRLRAKQKPWSRASWKIFPLPPKFAVPFWNLLNLPLDYFVGKHDLIHTSDWTQPRTFAPSVTTVHDLVFKRYPETLPRFVVKTQETRLKRAVKRAAHFLADSESTKKDLVKYYQLPTSRISVVYPGVSVSYTPQKNTDITRVKNKYHLPDQYLLTLSTREPRKNLTRLIKAYQSLLESEPSLPPLVIAGRYGWGAEKNTSSHHLLQTGFVDDNDLPALYSGATLFLFPSLYEGFGFPVLESMACGTPVVASNVSSLPEIVGKAGVLVDPTKVGSIAEGIKKGLQNRPTLARLGLTQSRNFTWAKTAKMTLDVYLEVINRGKATSENRH